MENNIAFLVLLLIAPAVYAQTTHTVGGTSGWTNVGVNYATWASGQTFNTGDSLVFNYGPNHALNEVNQADYQSCNSANAISTTSTSPTTITLSSPGPRYFICPRSNHCSQGQQLMITVATSSTSPPSPTPPSGTTPSPPSGSPTMPTTPTPPAARSPPPPSSGATSFLNGVNSLMVGVSIVLAGVYGLMG